MTAVPPSNDLAARVASVPFWFHSIDLGGGVVTPGHKSPGQLRREADELRLPDLRGRSVLDIGAWDGYFSFEAERRGAARVVALDHFTWGQNMVGYGGYLEQCKREGVVPRRLEETPHFDPAGRPGMQGFLLAREALQSRVEYVFGDYMTAEVGEFDVVFYLGVLYHMQDPLASMRRVAAATKEVAVIETAGISVPGFDEQSLWEFYPSDELNDDATNWWAPNERALADLCRAAGFSRVEIVSGARRSPPLAARVRVAAGSALREVGMRPARQVERIRISAHAWK